MGLFLEGPPLVGKSTILRQQLLKGQYRVGGFCVQRLLSSSEQVFGYQLQGTAELTLATSSYVWAERDCFLTGGSRKIQNLSVFETLGTDLLAQALSDQYEVILIDEFGGIDLQVPAFYQLLVKLLKSSKKVVGVYKAPSNYQQQVQRQPGLAVEAERQELEALMVGQRLAVTQANLGEIEGQVAHYLGRSEE